MSETAPIPAESPPASWLNRNVVGAGLTSFLADAGYETASSILPGFLAALGGPIGPAALWLGLIEGISDAVSSSVKLISGWWGDRWGQRKLIVTAGYALSGSGACFFALATAWPIVLVGRMIAWFGRGIRGPLRDAILAESVEARDRGKVFGFHRAGDTLGAVVGPLLGALLLYLLKPLGGEGSTAPYRTLFWLTLIPGVGSAVAFAVLIRDARRSPNPKMRLWASIRSLPRGFRRFLVGVGVFGAGDFAPTLLVLAATEVLQPTQGGDAAAIGALLYALRNVTYAAASYPVGALSDRFSRRLLLALGYVLGALVIAGFALTLLMEVASVAVLALLFALAGVFIAVEDALEGALAADLVPDLAVRGTAYGVMGTVNSLGDFFSSVMVGWLWWYFGPVPGFLVAAALMGLGAVVLRWVR